MTQARDLNEEVLVALRRIMRAIDLHSRRLVQQHGITGPQALILKRLNLSGPTTIGTLAREVNLSQGTVTGILDRLERRALVVRTRSEQDRRRVLVELTEAGRGLLEQTLPLLQESFNIRFNELQDWEQMQVVASLKRVAAMMDAERLDAAPVLATEAFVPLPADPVDEPIDERTEAVNA